MMDMEKKNYEFEGIMSHYVKLKELIEGVFNNVGIYPLLEIIERNLGCAVMITDMGFRVVAESPYVNGREQYHYCYQDNVFLVESCIELIRSHYVFRKMGEKEFSYAVFPHEEFSEFMVASIKVSDVDVLMITIFRGDVPLDTIDFLLIKKICQVLSVEFQKENSFNRKRLAIPNHIISALLSGNNISKEEIQYKLSYIKWVNSEKFYIMLIQDAQNVEFDVRNSAVLNALKLYLSTEHCLIYDSNIVAYLTPDLFERLFHHMREEWMEFLLANNLRCAVSSCFSDITESKQYYLLARNTMKVAKRFNVTLGLFEEMRYEIIADSVEKRYRIQEFCHPAIITLLQYDKDHKTELYATMNGYLNDKNDPDMAAKKLFIHRSTLFYRINKIKELTGVEFDKTSELASLYYSIKLVELYGKETVLNV